MQQLNVETTSQTNGKNKVQTYKSINLYVQKYKTLGRMRMVALREKFTTHRYTDLSVTLTLT